MLTDKQAKGLRRWLCTGCKITLGYFDRDVFVLRERHGIVQLDIRGATSIERRCSQCGTINRISGAYSVDHSRS